MIRRLQSWRCRQRLKSEMWRKFFKIIRLITIEMSTATTAGRRLKGHAAENREDSLLLIFFPVFDHKRLIFAHCIVSAVQEQKNDHYIHIFHNTRDLYTGPADVCRVSTWSSQTDREYTTSRRSTADSSLVDTCRMTRDLLTRNCPANTDLQSSPARLYRCRL